MWNEQPAPAIDAEALELLVEMIGPDEPAAVLDLLDTYIADSTVQVAELAAGVCRRRLKEHTPPGAQHEIEQRHLWRARAFKVLRDT